MKLTDEQIRMMQEETAAELVELIVKDQQLSIEQGLDVLYQSETFEKLMDKTTGLYAQSTGYVYSYFLHEQHFGKVG